MIELSDDAIKQVSDMLKWWDENKDILNHMIAKEKGDLNVLKEDYDSGIKAFANLLFGMTNGDKNGETD